MFVDFHWHARDWAQSGADTVANSLAVAEAGGVEAVAAMPNTNPALTSLDLCRDYLRLADSCNSRVYFFVHIGLTPDVEQVKRAVEASRLESRIIGLKAYWGSSTGGLLVGKEEEQYRVLETLAKEGFDGVLVGHFEDEAEIEEGLYNPQRPVTWSELCRPEIVEISSFNKIRGIAEAVGFKGRLHVAHVSTCQVADAVSNYDGSLNLSCDVSFHHLMFNSDNLKGPGGFWYKCNPPLRCEETRKGLWDRFVKGNIDFAISDHAPHTMIDKVSQNPASGIVSGVFWPYMYVLLMRESISQSVKYDLLRNNALKLYGVELEKRSVPYNFEKVRGLQKSYPFDFFDILSNDK